MVELHFFCVENNFFFFLFFPVTVHNYTYVINLLFVSEFCF